MYINDLYYYLYKLYTYVYYVAYRSKFLTGFHDIWYTGSFCEYLGQACGSKKNWVVKGVFLGVFFRKRRV